LAKQLAGYSIEGNRATILADTALAVLSRLKKNNPSYFLGVKGGFEKRLW
jgi:hypothetical protein